MNGQKQRNALTATERALAALGKGDPDGALRAMARAVELDQLGIYEAVRDAVELASGDLATGGEISEEHWDRIAQTLGPGPLAATVENLRSS